MLRQASSYKQPTIAPATDRELRSRGVLIRNQPLRRRNEIVKYILLVSLRARQMPLLSILTAAPQIRLRVDTAHFQPNEIWDRKRRRQRNVEPAIGIQQSRILPIQLQPFLIRQEHRHPRAVFAVVEHLLGLVLGRVKIHFRLFEYRTFSRRRLVPVNRGRRDEAGERVERLLVLSFSLKARSRPNSR